MAGIKRVRNFFKKASYEESVEALNRAITFLIPKMLRSGTPKLPKPWHCSLPFDGNRSQYNESLKAQDKAIELDPGNSTLHIHKGFFIANLADLSGHKNEPVRRSHQGV